MNQYEIELQIELPLHHDLAKKLRETAVTTLLQQQVPLPGALTILITGDDQIRQLNRDFLNQDSPTDVLSFPAGDAMPGMEPYLGDIAISVPHAERQAAAGGHNLLSELQLLVVHGILHLLGFDHGEPEEKAIMWQVQAAVLDELKAELTAPASEA